MTHGASWVLLPSWSFGKQVVELSFASFVLTQQQMRVPREREPIRTGMRCFSFIHCSVPLDLLFGKEIESPKELL